MSNNRIVELANKILNNTLEIDTWLREHQLPTPSFDQDGPVDLQISSSRIQNARSIVMEASLELHDLMVGPSLLLRPSLNGSALHAIYAYNIAPKVPLNGEASFEDLASQCDLAEPDLRRLLRYAMTYHRVFQEHKEGFVSHTAASRKLVEDQNAVDGVGSMYGETFQAFAHTVEALQNLKGPDPNKTGWNVANKTELSMYEYHGLRPDLKKRFGGAMAAFTNGPGLSADLLARSYPWSSVGNGSGTVVDVGGSSGHISNAIARTAPTVRFIVQDLPEVVHSAQQQQQQQQQQQESSDTTRRIEFMVHDFFQEQPIKADVYFFRQIFHNWSDSYCIRILRALVPALEPGNRVLINDHLVPGVGKMPFLRERAIRHMDLVMLSLFNAREREEQDWIKLFEQADPRFGGINVWVPEGATLALIEAVWSG